MVPVAARAAGGGHGSVETWERKQRVAALRSYGILDTPREEEFDEIVRVVSALCDTPISVINLIDRERQWFKAEVGLGMRETPLPALDLRPPRSCSPTCSSCPTRSTTRGFADNPLVTGNPHLRFYAGALLETPEGLPLGTICVLDYEPRELDENQKALLRLMAQQIMKLFELARRPEAPRSAARARRAEMARPHHRHQAQRRGARGRVAQEQFIAVLGHDLRNPLASIQAAAAPGEARQARPRRDACASPTAAVERMSALIDNILDFARGRLGDGIDLARKATWRSNPCCGRSWTSCAPRRPSGRSWPRSHLAETSIATPAVSGRSSCRTCWAMR